MANIMITERCNLKCPYCFANEFVNKHPNDITIQNFRIALDFVATDSRERVGIIGGEPCLHPDFQKIIETLIYDNRIKNVVLFTNGVYIDKYIKLLTHEKIHLLINCNPPSSIGKEAFKKLQNNLDLFVQEYYLKSKITLGINMYRPDFEYEYMLDFLQKYQYDYVRTSIVVPNTDGDRQINPLEYFRYMKASVKKFFIELSKRKVLPHYDCNLMPSCVLDEEEKEQIAGILKANKVNSSNLLGEVAICKPVIDILPDLSAVRCFGLSNHGKVAINRFKTITELHYYFLNMFDVFAYNTIASSECLDCEKRITMKCTGGCMAFKAPQILKLQSVSSELMHQQGEKYELR